MEAFVEVKYYYKEAFYTLEAQLNTYTWLFYFKKVYIKVRFKKYYLVKQGLYKLKVKKRKNSI